ncbi:MAG: hypothetical protein LR011_14490 [Verrucomicrobia bacterium]|nr:hypothetical protein [Verrucomicrobiota bacterium]
MVVSLGFSYGRHFFLYSMIHPLPFFNSIRNPIKFLHPMTIGLVILSVYGLKSILTSWADSSSGKKDAAASGGTTKEKRDPARLAAAILLGVPGLALLILLMVAGQRSTIQANAIAQLVPEGVDAASAQLISQFVMGETFWFFIFCTLSAGTLAMALKGRIPNRHGSLLPACILVLLVLDLWRADQPWIHHFDAGGKYVKDELVSALEPENGLSRGRVTTAPFNNNVFMNYVATFYRAEWLQHQFPYFNIASIDVPQESRPAVDFETFRTALSPTNNPARLRRFWELTSTRYILGLAQGVVDLLNSNFDPERMRFQVLKPFTIDEEIANRDNNVRALPSAQGPFAVIEFSGALERAVLYQNWMVHTNSNELLRHLADLSWDPMESVLVNGPQSPNSLPNPVTRPAAR